MSADIVFSGPDQSIAHCVAGIDEAGRGPLAGPVFAAAVVLAPGQGIAGVKDSKQLSAKRREALFEQIQTEAVSFAIARADVHEIDELNILQASLLAMRRALFSLSSLPGLLRFDGNQLPVLTGYAGRAEAVVGGDRHCAAIAAASILAKVARDREMLHLSKRYPGYGFAQHKGYPTQAHRNALLHLGPCAVHRRSFKPVQRLLNSRERVL